MLWKDPRHKRPLLRGQGDPKPYGGGGGHLEKRQRGIKVNGKGLCDMIGAPSWAKEEIQDWLVDG